MYLINKYIYNIKIIIINNLRETLYKCKALLKITNIIYILNKITK